MLLDAIRQRQEAGGAAAPAVLPDPADLRALLFCNTRSLRLRAEGFRLLARFFEPFPVDLPPEREIRSSYVIYLDRQASLPWYIGQSRGVRQITLFDSRMATELRLRGDDFDKLLKSRRLYGHGRKPRSP
jgi:hypothetical protein